MGQNWLNIRRKKRGQARAPDGVKELDHEADDNQRLAGQTVHEPAEKVNASAGAGHRQERLVQLWGDLAA